MTVPKRLLGLLLGLFVVFAFTACSDDGGGDDASDGDTTDEADDGAACNADTAQADIMAAMDSFLSEPEAEDKVVSVENGDELVDFLTETGSIAEEQGLVMEGNPTITNGLEVDEVTDTSATFTYDLAFSMTPDEALGLALAGDAVCVDGEWLISTVTVCDLSAQGPYPPELLDECYSVAGIEI